MLQPHTVLISRTDRGTHTSTISNRPIHTATWAINILSPILHPWTPTRRHHQRPIPHTPPMPPARHQLQPGQSIAIQHKYPHTIHRRMDWEFLGPEDLRDIAPTQQCQLQWALVVKWCQHSLQPYRPRTSPPMTPALWNLFLGSTSTPNELQNTCSMAPH